MPGLVQHHQVVLSSSNFDDPPILVVDDDHRVVLHLVEQRVDVDFAGGVLKKVIFKILDDATKIRSNPYPEISPRHDSAFVGESRSETCTSR